MSFGLLQMFVELWNLHNRVQVLSIPVLLIACSEDWTYNLQMIVSLKA